nr:MAG TPA: peptidoglycan hydrolase [Caudoviricetes sp.]
MSLKNRVLESGLLEVTQEYKPGVHNGIDVVNQNYTLGNIVAHSNGVVVGCRNNCNGFENGSYGNYVKIKHDNGYYTLYGHMAYNTVKVSVGQRVSKGQVLGYMGNTGMSYGGHLHFEVRNTNDVRIDPTEYLNSDLPNSQSVPTKSVEELAQEVIAGKYGNGEDRKNALGDRYVEVQARVNEILAPAPEPSVDILDLVRKTIRGDFGNGEDRRNALGSNYDEVQRQVNLNFQNGTTNWDSVRLY